MEFTTLNYRYEDISRATDNFSSTHQLGKGTYGSVYKGTLRDGTEVYLLLLLFYLNTRTTTI